MTFIGKALADGYIGTTLTVVYTVPASTVGYVKFLSVYNSHATTQTVILYVNTTGTSRPFATMTLAQNEFSRVIDRGETMILSAGDTIEAITDTVSAVHYTIQGVEEA